MKISLRWLNEYLQPGDLTPQEAERLLTFAGFPIESTDSTADGDSVLDVEVTSNRGDVLSHVGVAREVAALSGRAFKPPFTPGASASDAQCGPCVSVSHVSRDVPGLTLDNLVPGHLNEGPGGVGAGCPIFTARLIKGVKVGPSPARMVRALEAVGQRSINNVVDATNFAAAELGQPSHVFDWSTVAKSPDGSRTVTIRLASKGEKLALLDGKTITLAGDELVVADPSGPVSLAGVMGGASTQVSNTTTDVLLEVATWEPAIVRRAARRHNIRTEASHRFERIVDPRTVHIAADRIARLIVEVAGGTIDPPIACAGAPFLDHRTVDLRPARVGAMLGLAVGIDEIRRILTALEIAVEAEPASADGALRCAIPPHRPDLEREIDLIEEIARVHGIDQLPVRPYVPVIVREPQRSERAMRELTSVLTGQGYFETVTFSFVSAAAAKPFLPKGLSLLSVQDERRKADPILRPSVLCGLLACRRANRDTGGEREHRDGASWGASAADAGVRLFEISSVFADQSGGTVENVNLGLLADVCFPAGAKAFEQKQAALRTIRGTIESLARALGGAGALVDVAPITDSPVSAFESKEPGGCSAVSVRATTDAKPVHLGLMGLLSSALRQQIGLETPVVMAELNLPALIDLFPGRSLVHELPAFPSIERDLSLIINEDTPWARIDALVHAANVERLESASFVGAYRGPQAGPGRKSVTLRLRFRDPARTLRHEEVDGPVQRLVDLAKRELGAELRVV
ncbi:MAG: phenylalanine--tRNA ligase subunit beta [Phycisphaeraceae bacterium]|nr:phenylalanine--tRNA ligase subunit beta [Phycisphaeraceae bacterium]